MRLLFILTLLALPLTLTACKTTAEGKHGRISVEDGDHDGHYGDKHCPPGHHKKGWC